MRNIPELNGLRGIAVLAVVFHHVCYSTLGSVVDPHWSPTIRALGYIAKYGDTGVDLFFVLSGFLISSILIRDRKSATYYQDFYWKRLLRIGPVLAVALLVTLLLHEYRYALISFALLGNFAYQLHAAGTAPFWSLAIEEQFYLLWPTAIRRMSTSLLQKLAVTFIAGTIILRYLFAIVGHTNYHLTFLRVDTLAAGSLFAIFIVEQRSLTWLLGIMSTCGILCLLIGRIYVNQFQPATLEAGIGLLCAAIVGAAIAYSGAPIFAPLRSKSLLFFAEISYALYLFHLFVLNEYDRHIGQPAPGNNNAYWSRLTVLFVGSIAVSVVSRYALELPVISLRKRVLAHPHVTNPATEPPLPLSPM